jgi:putative hemolysin
MKSADDELGFRLSSKRLPPGFTHWANRQLDRLFGFDAFNAFFREAPECADTELMQAVLDTLGVRVELAGGALDAIPKTGALVVVSNHPFGVADGMMVGALVQSVRSDTAGVAAHWLSRVKRFRTPYLIVVGAQGASKRRRQSTAGWLSAVRWLKRGGAVVIFPAGRVARFRWRRLAIADMPWSPHAAGLIRKTSAHVLPVFCEGRNSAVFYALTAFFPGLANFLLVREFLKKRNTTARVVIGRLIAPAELMSLGADEAAIEFLREQVERLAR